MAYTVKIPVRHRGLGGGVTGGSSAGGVACGGRIAQRAMSPLPGAAEDLPNCDEINEVVVTGGVKQGDQAEWVDDGKDAPPELPTIEDDGR